jgi:hypothetical protein
MTIISQILNTIKKGCATFALIFLFGGKAMAKAGASRGHRCACPKANRVHMVFHIYQSTLTRFNINYIICRNVEIFKNYNNNKKSKEQNFVKKERREYFRRVRNILVLFDMESS